MSFAKKSWALLGSFTALAVCVPTANATNGYFAHSYGARSKALAGASTGFAQDAIVSAINPAGLAYVGDRLDLEFELFSPHREYRVNGAGMLATGSVESDSEYFPVPTLGRSYKLDAEQTLGLAMYGNGGMNTDYKPLVNGNGLFSGANGTFGAGRTGIDMAQAFIVGTYAHSFANGRYALGISPIFAAQTFKARGLGTFGQFGFSSEPDHLSDQGRDYSFGAGFRIGGLAELLPGLRLGASYKSRIYMSKFERYSGLFAQGGGFDIPDSFNVGLSWDVSKALTANFDVEHIRYSEIKSVGNTFQGNLLGHADGRGFGWNDMTIYKAGVQWQQSQDWIWRGGLSYGQQPIEGSEVLFNILAPGVQEWHVTGGLSHALSKQDELSFAFMYSPQKTITGPNPLSPGQSIDLSMSQFSLQFGWTRRF
ncbi:OmpP1/FadL family transporter [Methylomonas sp. TEB]|uniref:OmpP1/FadL family transporter n=1 Tax=Methylomonas sp. TEB TaxID=3398229 RepID=UPI0039F5058C